MLLTFAQVIKPSKYFQMQKEGDFCTLRISEAFPEDEGIYKCIAKNPAGEITTSANLRVLGKTKKRKENTRFLIFLNFFLSTYHKKLTHHFSPLPISTRHS